MNRVSDLTGHKFGRLTVIERDMSTPNGRSKWICRCSCGNVVSVSRNHLVSGDTVSCGCAKKGVNAKDITGKKFGRLTAIERTKKKSGNAYIYKCRCDCGKICYVSGANLRNGTTTSCGCYAADVHRRSFVPVRKEREQLYVDGTDILQISNHKLPKNNTSGCKGVVWDRSVKTWKAYITFKGKRYYLGSSTDKDEAVALRKAAEKEIFGNFLEGYNNSFSESGGNNEEI